MRTFAYFWVVFVLAALLPHIEGWLRLPYLTAFGFALYRLLWVGLPRE